MQNITHIIQKNNSVIVCAGQENPEDSFSAALAVCGVVQARNKQAFLFSCVPIPQRLNFLPFNSIISPNSPFIQKSSVCVATQHDVSDIHYTQENNQFYITLSRNDTVVPYEDLTIQPPPPQTEYVIALGCSENEIRQLSQVYSIDPQNISSIQKQDLDKHNTTSYCELLVQMFKMDARITVTQDIATILLTGIVLSTNNFQRKDVKPQTFFSVAYLVAQNADKEHIIQNLYKTRTLSFMQAWGVLLKRFAADQKRTACWSYITQQELNARNIQPHEVHLLVEELQNITAGYGVVVLGIQKHNTLFCFCITEKNIAPYFNTISKKGMFVVPVRTHNNTNATLQLLARKIHSYL